METWYAENVATRLPALAATVIATRPDVILTTAESPARAVTSQTRIPVVFAIARDPIATGLAKSLQHPGGTATGLVTFAPELSAKRVQILREAFPKVSHVAALYANDDPVGSRKSARSSGRRAGSACASPRSASRALRISCRHSSGARASGSMAS